MSQGAQAVAPWLSACNLLLSNLPRPVLMALQALLSSFLAMKKKNWMMMMKNWMMRMRMSKGWIWGRRRGPRGLQRVTVGQRLMMSWKLQLQAACLAAQTVQRTMTVMQVSTLNKSAKLNASNSAEIAAIL